MVETEEKKEEHGGAEAKQNASERINLQHIMELREAFESADKDGGNDLDEKEFIEHFGDVIGKGMNPKQLRSLFMKIDADAGGTVDWTEFMNYMLLENQTLSMMKNEISYYVKSERPDPQATKKEFCHSKNITCILILYPEMTSVNTGQSEKNKSGPVPGSAEYRKGTKYVTGSQDGCVKIWEGPPIPENKSTSGKPGPTLRYKAEIQVSKYWVTAMAFMTASKRLAVATSDRMISFYDFNGITPNNQPLKSRIENLVGMPNCLEYIEFLNPKDIAATKKNQNQDNNKRQKVETLLMGDDLGFIHMYNFYDLNWHYCFYKDYSQLELRDPDEELDDPNQNAEEEGKADGKEGNTEETPIKKKPVAAKKVLISSVKKKSAPQEEKRVTCCPPQEFIRKYNEEFNKKYLAEEQIKAKARAVLESKRIEMYTKGSKTEEEKQQLKKELSAAKEKFIAKSKPVLPAKYQERKEHVEVIRKWCHKSWITKIKYYPDIQNLVSSSLDGCIHIHDVKDLEYKEGRTFNLHQKGVNAFVYSSQHKVIASCGEERQIILWNPFTLMAQTYLPGHTTAVQDLALNEDKNHLISLGTDKVVKIWHLHNYLLLQTITDKFCYRPDDVLNSLHFDKWTNNIVLGSRKVNFWFFKTQEEIKTSHEFPVVFALFNTEFESIVSADKGGYITVWDIENGKLMSKYQATSESKPQITAGCFDSTSRRLVTASEGGYCKIWNFSNGQCLKSVEREKTIGSTVKWSEEIDTEVTGLCCVFQPDNEDEDPNAQFAAVGWDRRVRIWRDNRMEKPEEDAGNDVVRIPRNKDWPLIDNKSVTRTESHNADIMSVVYHPRDFILFTGGHDGTLFGWHTEASSIKYHLHLQDKDCVIRDRDGKIDSMEGVKKSKSVDCMEIIVYQDQGKVMKNQPKYTEEEIAIQKENGLYPMPPKRDHFCLLLSGTANQCIRFWNLQDMPSPPLEVLDVNHGPHGYQNNDPTKSFWGESLTTFRATKDGTLLVTGDTAGQLKCWDLSKVDWQNDKKPAENIVDRWFIRGHRKCINTIQLAEAFADDTGEIFVISASDDCNILIHRLSNGVKIGQLGQEKLWDIYNMSPYSGQKPNYVASWFNNRRETYQNYYKEKFNKLQIKFDPSTGQFDSKDKQPTDMTKMARFQQIRDDLLEKPSTLILKSEQRAERIQLSKQVHRNLIKELINEDENYEEAIPFPDYSSDSELSDDPHADMKGRALNMNNYTAFKNAREKKPKVRNKEVAMRERNHTEPKEYVSIKFLDRECKKIKGDARKVMDNNRDRSNKLF